MNTRSTIGMLAIAALSIAVTPVAISAQVQDVPRQNAPSIEGAQAYSESELKSFAVAAIEVRRINDAYLPRLEAAKSVEEEQVVIELAAGEMTQVIQQQGMSLQRFTQILNHAQSNDDLADRVRKHIQEVQ